MIWALIKAFFLYVFLRLVFGAIIFFLIAATAGATGQPGESLLPLVSRLSDCFFWVALVMSALYFLAAWK